MKKIIIFFTIILSILTYIISFNKFDIESINKINNLEMDLSTPFTIPNLEGLPDPNKISSILKNVSKKLNVNIYRKSVVSNNLDIENIKYVLINNTDSKYIESFKFNKGTYITDLTKNKFISTYKTNDPNQIGTVYDFANNDTFFIKSFDTLFNTLPVSGTYYVDLSSGTTYKEFVNTLVDDINSISEVTYSINDFKYNDITTDSFNKEPIYILKYINIILIIICVMIIIFYILKNSKKISIYKLNGVSNIKIWFELIHYNLIKSYLSTSIIIFISTVLLRYPLRFIILTVCTQVLYFLIFTLLLIIPFIIVIKSDLVLNIKNKTNDIYLIVLNLLAKTLIISILSSFIVGLFYDINNLSKDLSNIDQWEESNGYGVIYPVLIGNDDPNNPYFHVDLTSKLYNYLNKNGALFIDAGEYQDDIITGPDFNRNFTIKANPNYLRKVGIKDVNNNLINISEDETSWIVLVPEKFKKDEKKILKDIKSTRNECYNFELDDIKNKSSIKNIIEQKIKIIWIKNDQEVFSFNPGVKKDNYNMVKDPFIEVITEQNSLPSDKWGTWGDGGTSPLKVKLINNSNTDTYEDLLPLLKELELDDNLTTIINTNELMLLNINELKDKIKTSSIVITIIFTVLLLTIIQNNIIIYNKYKQKFIIKRSFGIGFVKSYQEYLIIFIGSYLVQNIIQFISYGKIIKDLLLVISSIYSLDLLSILIVIFILERKNKIRVLKGA